MTASEIAEFLTNIDTYQRPKVRRLPRDVPPAGSIG